MIDLHVHTNHSDGRLAPAEVVLEAAARGLSALAITDHDVLTALPDAQIVAEAAGIELVPGIEMTAGETGGRPVHVLGLFVDSQNTALQGALEHARELMARHVDTVLAAIRAVGGTLELDHLERYRTRYAGGAALVLGMTEHGVLRGAPPGTGFRLLKMAAAEPRAYTVQQAVDLVHTAGGVACLAHPAKLKRGQPLLDVTDLQPYAALGFDAIEAWQWIPNGWGSQHYQCVAAELGLLVSGGSDDHGKRLPDGRMRLGSQAVPDALLEPLRRRATEWAARCRS